MYKIQIVKSAHKALLKIPSDIRKKIADAINKLAFNPHPDGSKKLKGSQFYRIRAGDYRIIYTIEENILTILVVRIGHRKEVYKK